MNLPLFIFNPQHRLLSAPGKHSNTARRLFTASRSATCREQAPPGRSGRAVLRKLFGYVRVGGFGRRSRGRFSGEEWLIKKQLVWKLVFPKSNVKYKHDLTPWMKPDFLNLAPPGLFFWSQHEQRLKLKVTEQDYRCVFNFRTFGNRL